jgi:hypothetical protein
MMTFKELRRFLANNGSSGIRWNKSGIVELAVLELNGAVRVINIISQKSYILPKMYKEVDISIVLPHELVSVTSLAPREMRHEGKGTEATDRGTIR